MARRREMLCGLPFQRVDYLQSTGTQYIDSGVRARTTLRVDAEFEITESQNDTALCGAKGTGNNRCVPFAMFFTTYATPPAQLVFRNGGDDTMTVSSSVATDTRYTYSATVGSTLSATLNGTTVTKSGGTIDAGTTLRIFAREWNGNINAFSKIKLYWMKIWLDGEMMRDFVPIVKDGIGYLYDKVSGEKFGNSGTGAFIVGPDVSAVNGGGYKLKWLACVYTRSSRPSARFCALSRWEAAA